MTMFQVWLRKRGAVCSHTETVYMKATTSDAAWTMAEAMFRDSFTVKAVLTEENWIPQDQCGCGETLTAES